MPGFEEARAFPARRRPAPRAVRRLGRARVRVARAGGAVRGLLRRCPAPAGVAAVRRASPRPGARPRLRGRRALGAVRRELPRGLPHPVPPPGPERGARHGELQLRAHLGRFSSLQLALARDGDAAFELPPGSPDHGERVAAYYWWVFPNLMLNFYPWGLSLNLVQPLAPDRTRVRFRGYVRDAGPPRRRRRRRARPGRDGGRGGRRGGAARRALAPLRPRPVFAVARARRAPLPSAAVRVPSQSPRRPPRTARMLDVLVIGGGNAALCAALMAREAGASVLLLEAAPREWRGGNSPHTRNLRCMHDAPQDVLVDAYPEEEYWQDLLQGHRRRDRRDAGAHRDSRIGRPAATGCGATACTSSRRCPARCTSRAPTRSSWAAARRSSTRTTEAPRGSASRSATTRRSTRLELRRRPLRRGRRRRASASRRAPACWRPAASSRTASGCARRGA